MNNKQYLKLHPCNTQADIHQSILEYVIELDSIARQLESKDKLIIKLYDEGVNQTIEGQELIDTHTDEEAELYDTGSELSSDLRNEVKYANGLDYLTTESI